MSRLPLPKAKEQVTQDCQDYLNFVEGIIPIDINLVRSETRKDPIFGNIINFIRYGCPKQTDNELLKPYCNRKSELSFDNGVIMWGYRVVIPTTLRQQLLKELQITHEGMVKI